MQYTINNVVMVGRLVRDPILKEVAPGLKACRLTIVTEWEDTRRTKKETCFIDCTAWSAQADECMKYLKKGSILGVAGRLKLEQWETNGEKKSKHVLVIDTITFMERVNQNLTIADAAESKPQPKPQPKQVPVEEFSGDELPF